MRTQATPAATSAFLASFALATVLAAAGDAEATTLWVSFHPAKCWAETDDTTGNLNAHYDLRNTSTTANLTVTCPLDNGCVAGTQFYTSSTTLNVGVYANLYGGSGTTEITAQACDVYYQGGGSCGSTANVLYGAGQTTLHPSTSAFGSGTLTDGYIVIVTLAPEDSGGTSNQLDAYSATTP